MIQEKSRSRQASSDWDSDLQHTPRQLAHSTQSLTAAMRFFVLSERTPSLDLSYIQFSSFVPSQYDRIERCRASTMLVSGVQFRQKCQITVVGTTEAPILLVLTSLCPGVQIIALNGKARVKSHSLSVEEDHP